MAPRKPRIDADTLFVDSNPLVTNPEIQQVIAQGLPHVSQQAIAAINWTSHGSIGTAETSLTGSAHIIELTRRTGEQVKILLDLGMFQGKGQQLNNTLPIQPEEIDAVVLTHGHLDHCGRLPLLRKDADKFVGEIHSTPGTRETAFLTMKDSAKISENGYDEKYEKFIKLVRSLQFAERIVRSHENKGVPRNARNGDRLKGTGELPESIGEGQNGRKVKNRVRGGKAIHEVSVDTIKKSKELLEEYGIYSTKDGRFTGKKVAQVVKAPERNLYTVEDVHKLEMYFQTMDYHETKEILPGVNLTFSNAGHIAGSAMAQLDFDIGEGKSFSVLYTGDIGRLHGVFHPYGSPSLGKNKKIDVIAHETTYGGQVHIERENAKRILGETIRDAQRKGKKAIIIPTFAIERCASLLYTVQKLREEQFFEGEIILDSPLGLDQTLVASRAAIDEDFSEVLKNKKNFKFWKAEDRDSIEKGKKFKVIITGSGMANGGPVLDYLKRYSNDDMVEFAFVGYQAEGTIGRQITVDRRKSIEIDGLKLEVRARIHSITGFSAHADEKELYDLLYADRVHAKKPTTRREHQETQYLLIHGEDGGSRDAFEHMLERRTHDLAKKGRHVIMPKVTKPALGKNITLYTDGTTLQDTKNTSSPSNKGDAVNDDGWEAFDE